MIVIVSGDLQFRSLVGAELQEKGYEVEGTGSLAGVLSAWTREGKPPELVLVETSGQELFGSALSLLGEVSRKSIVVVCVGALERSVDFASYGVRKVISRPVSVGDIVAEIVKIAPRGIDRQ